MATTPQATPGMQDQGAATPPGGGVPPAEAGAQTPPQATPPTPPSQAPANQMQMLLARWYQTVKQIAASDPRLAAGAEKIAQGIQDMQTALVSPPQPTPMGQQPMY